MRQITGYVFLFFILFATLISLPLAAQKSPAGNYTRWWKKIDSLVLLKGLPKSALSEVERLYQQAVKEKQEGQQLKALVYRMELSEGLTENSDTLTISNIKTALKTAGGAKATILHTLLADAYRNYFERKRWELLQLTALEPGLKKAISQWSAKDFQQAIALEYDAALKPKQILQQTALSGFDPVIIKGNARKLRPTLYDLVAWKALDFYQGGRLDQQLEENPFTLAAPELFSQAIEFVNLVIKAENPSDPYFKAILLYQELLRFHKLDKELTALLDADLHRLQYVYENGIINNKAGVYRQALEKFLTANEGKDAGDQAGFQLAQSYISTLPFDYKRAAAICEKITRQPKNSEGYFNCYNLLQEIKAPELELTIEKVNLPGQPMRSLLKWKNLGSVSFKLFRITNELRSIFNQRNSLDSIQWSKLLQQPSIRQWNQSLPVISDYAQHSAECKIDAVPIGEYILVASSQENFATGKSHLSAARFHVSNISYVKNGSDYFFLHRASGEPLGHTAISTVYQEYDYSTRSYRFTAGKKYLSNEQGYLHLVTEGKNRDFQLNIRYKEDSLRLDDLDNSYNYNPQNFSGEDPVNTEVYFFLDRSIYRPGQTVFFKGIAVGRNQGATAKKVLVNTGSVVTLFNANHERIDSQQVTTNGYGSYTGSFRIPETGLTGGFSLEDGKLHGNARFGVEDYKRPRFFIEYAPQKNASRLNDSVIVQGIAKSYAGNAINDAQINYRVIRRSRFLYPWRSFSKGGRSGSSQEIGHGKLIADKNGSFSLGFLALPDESINKSADPVFDFEVTVNITDLNGETRTATTVIPVAYKALQLKISTSSPVLPVDSFSQVFVRTQNLKGEFEPAKLRVTLQPLESPGRLIRSRLWPQPDTFLLREQEFLQYFPLDEYRQETNPATWKAGAEIWSAGFNSDPSEKINISQKISSAGWYKLTATSVDRFGDTVTDFTTVRIIDTRRKTLTQPSYLTILQSKDQLQPGQEVSLSFASNAGKLFVIQQKENLATDTENKWLRPFAERFRISTLDSTISSQSLTVTEADRGGIGWINFYVKDNRFYAIDNSIAVPWLNKELEIQVGTFRDKTLPGAEEKWAVSIRGKKGERKAAELLTGMYDASLDQFIKHEWSSPAIWPTFWSRGSWTGAICFAIINATNNNPPASTLPVPVKNYDQLISIKDQRPLQRMLESRADGVVVMSMSAPPVAEKKSAEDMVLNKAKPETETDQAGETTPAGTQAGTIRKDFRETAFFLPQLMADTMGNFSFSFTMPEAVTTWKWQLFAHSADLSMGRKEQTVITQKDLMVQPNMPRFLREGDRVEFTTKVVNLTDKEMTGQVELQLFDATTDKPVDGWFNNFFPNQYFTVAAGSSELVKFPLEVPYLFDKALTWKIVARSGNISDGETATLPVLSNRQLVTEALPFYINGTGSKQYTFKKLLESDSSESISNRSLVVEFTGNPAWYAVQALGWLSEYPYECAEQSFNRLYSNLLAARIVEKMPKIKSVFESWKARDTSELLSNLQKNSELKQVLLEETPWVLEAKSEAVQKRNLALLFNLVELSASQEKLLAKLLELQSPNGGFSWFKGGPDDRFITQYIVSGIGHLQKLGAIPKARKELNQIVARALPYLDARISEEYLKAKKRTSGKELDYYAIQYLYCRSFFKEQKLTAATREATAYYLKIIQTRWISGNLMAKGMIGLTLFRNNDQKTARQILNSLQQTAIKNPELGMYWKENTSGYYWRNAPIETQAILIEAFSETGTYQKETGSLKTWLLRQKQTNHWSSTKSTADACYALLLQGENWLENEPVISVQLGTVTTIKSDSGSAGTGYYQKTIPGTAIFPGMGKIKLNVQQPTGSKSTAPVWGAVYWQYFEDLDKIKSSTGALQIKKQVYVERASKSGPILELLKEGNFLQVGDKVKIRLEINSDRQLEYVHLKDQRASSLEPLNVLSGYKWKAGVGYYESTRDASTNFFIDHLPKGNFVVEYSLFVTHTGVYNNGISTIQCMYAPELTSHSESTKIIVE